MNLVKKLTSETRELKTAYLNDITKWAITEFSKLEKLSELNEFELGATLGFDSHIVTENICPEICTFTSPFTFISYRNGRMESHKTRGQVMY